MENNVTKFFLIALNKCFNFFEKKKLLNIDYCGTENNLKSNKRFQLKYYKSLVRFFKFITDFYDLESFHDVLLYIFNVLTISVLDCR